MGVLAQADPEIAQAIENEEMRQRRNLVLIASENYVSQAVKEAQGSVMTNKYAEGYPGRRYYGGCEYVDVAENLARGPSEEAVRRSARQCSTSQRRSGEYGRLFCSVAARRYCPWHAAGPGRSPYPRERGEFLR